MNLGFLSRNLIVAGHGIPLYYLLIAGVGAYFLLKKGALGGTPGMPKKVDVAPDVTFNLNPPTIMPNVPTNLVGQFQDEKGMSVTVKQGYWYIFLVMPTGQKRVVSQGSLGMNVSQFNVPINTTMLQPIGMNKYSLVVTDTPLSSQELTM